MLNFNQAALMAWCEEWSLCLHQQTVRWRDRLVQVAQVKQGDMTI